MLGCGVRWFRDREGEREGREREGWGRRTRDSGLVLVIGFIAGIVQYVDVTYHIDIL